MTKFTDRLWSDIAAEHGATLEQATRPGPARTRRPGLIAGGTLALAVGGTALALGLTSTGGAPAGSTSTAAGATTITTAAYTITKHSDGSILVKVTQEQSIVAADAKLKSMGVPDKISVFPKPGAAPVSGPTTCTPVDGASKQPRIQVLLGTNGTEVITPTAQNGGTGTGTWHLASCVVFPVNDKGNSNTGNTGTTGTASGNQTAADPAGQLVPGRDGSMIMWVNQRSGLAAAASKLAEVGIHGRPDVVMAPGAAPVKGPIDCKPAAGVPAPKVKLKLLLGQNGTVSFGPSTNGGTWHAASCTLLPAAK